MEFGVANNAQNLAGLTVVPESNSAMFYAAPTLGYALSNRFVGGGRLGIVAVSEEGESVDFSLRLNPYLRYYAINRPGLMVFGELATGGKAASGVVQLSENYRAATGGHLPLATGVLLTPRLDYNFGDRRNSLTLGAGIELVLGAKDDGEDRSVATFARGSWMLGTQLISLEPAPRCLLWRGSPQRALFSYRPADHTRCCGGSNGSYQSGFFRNDSNDFSFNSFGYGLGLGSRYYLTTARHFGWLAQLDAGWNHRVALEAGPQVQRLLFDEGGAQWILGLNVGVQFLL